MTDPAPLLGAIEAGGTKIIAAIGSAAASRATIRIPTGEPGAAVAAIARFFAGQAEPPAAVGVASFGPIDLDRASPGYGHLLKTPKPGWEGFDLAGRLGEVLGVPIALETDVNAAALAEARIGAGAGRGDLAYVTVGTGIGVGLIVNGAPVHGIAHPEGGHLRPRRHPAHQGFAGICPFHGDCLEGLASGPAIAAAWGQPAESLAPDHPAWTVEADYLGQLCTDLILLLAPATIVLGGGVMEHAGLLAPIRARTAELLGGYGRASDAAALARRIVAPGSPQAPGLAGAYLIAGERLTEPA